jgi:NMD protein affecting ribosome stability and mRNA decay
MTLEEFIRKSSELKEKYDTALRKLKIQCATSNMRFKVGDIISDNRGEKMLVEKLAISTVYMNMPEMVYTGHVFFKNGKLNARKKYAISESAAVLVTKAEDVKTKRV